MEDGVPLVTIVITSYNYGRYLGQSIQSAADQSYPNIEVLVLDNCSTDDSRAVMATFAGHPRVQLIYNDTNLGRVGNTRKGIGEARGDYVSVLSADDRLVPTAVEELMGEHRRRPGQDFVYANAWLCDAGGEIVGESILPGHLLVRGYSGRNEFRALVGKHSYMWLPTFVATRDILAKVDSFDEKVSVAADWDMQLRMMAAEACGSFLNRPLALVRMHGENATMTGYQASGADLRETVEILDRVLDGDALDLLDGAESMPLDTIELHASGRFRPGGERIATALRELQPTISAIAYRMDRARLRHRSESLHGAPVSTVVVIPDGTQWGAAIETLRSVECQTYSNVETVVVHKSYVTIDDDPSGLTRIGRARWFAYVGDADIDAMRQTGADLANGRVLMFLTPGVTLAPNHVDEAINVLVDNPDADLALSDFSVVLEAEPVPLQNHAPILFEGQLNVTQWLVDQVASLVPILPVDAVVIRREAVNRFESFVDASSFAGLWQKDMLLLLSFRLAFTGMRTVSVAFHCGEGSRSVRQALGQLNRVIGVLGALVPLSEESEAGAERSRLREQTLAMLETLDRVPEGSESWWDGLNALYAGRLQKLNL